MPLKDPKARKAYAKAYRARPGKREKAKAAVAAFNQRNLNYSKQTYEKFVADNPNYYRERNLKRYGLTLQKYEEIFNAQNNCCSICKSDKHNGISWHIDHDHITNKIRGILCNNCNVGLRHFKESTELLKIAIQYLNKSKWV